MSNEDVQRSIEEIRSLRSQGLITPEEAYRRHTAALAALSPALSQVAAVSTPVVAPPSAIAAAKTGQSRLGLDVLAVVLALAGGIFGIVGALVQEVQAGGGVLLVFAGAPIIEEALKPAGIYILLGRWPQAVRGRLHVASLTALSGLCFGLIESFFYVTFYYPDGSSDYVLFRYTVPVAMHVIASFIVGLGLSRSLIDWASGRAPLSKATRNFYLAGVALHAVYNTTAVILSLAGVIDFD
jgi:hypothetical protein